MKFQTVEEGKAKLIVSKGPKISKELTVFYNSEKEFDRSLSVLFLRAVKKTKVLDLLAASGARGIRLAKEANAKVWYNDVNPDAIKILKKNLKANRLLSKSKVFNMQANSYLISTQERFDFIDIDPFGSPIRLIFNAIKRLNKEGYLAVTATDTAPLYGVYKWTCMRKYGSIPIRSKISHEIGLRILTKAVIEMGAKWNVSLIPVFAHATKHYYRVYFKHKRSHVQKLIEKIGFIHMCEKCKNRFSSGFRFDQKCKCGGRLQSAGPLYLGNLWDSKLVDAMIKENKKRYSKKSLELVSIAGSMMGKTVRPDQLIEVPTYPSIEKFLKIIKQESKINVPYHFLTEEFIELEPRIEEIIKKLKKKGFKASRTHFAGKGIRTNASINDLKKLK